MSTVIGTMTAAANKAPSVGSMTPAASKTRRGGSIPEAPSVGSIEAGHVYPRDDFKRCTGAGVMPHYARLNARVCR